MALVNKVLVLWAYLSLLTAGINGRTPPTLSMPRDWMVGEQEPVGAVVARITAQDDEGDVVHFSVAPPKFGDDGSSLVSVDQGGVVRVAKSLQGLGGRNFFVGIVATDGEFTTRSETRLEVQSPHGKTPRGGLWAALNPNSSPPFGAAFPPLGVPANPALGLPGRRPTIPIPFNEPEPSGSPPLLMLPTPATWRVPASSSLNALVAVVEARDLSGDDFFFTIKDAEDLLTIDRNTGEVRVKASLKDKMGEHFVRVEVSNRHGTADEDVLLHVVSDETDDEPSSKHTSTEVELEPSTRPTLIAIINNGPTPPATTVRPPVLEDNVSAASVMLGLACGLLSWCCCCRKPDKKPQKKLSSKESSMKFDKKSLELTPVSSASSSLSRMESQILPSAIPPILRFWERRASENKYEDGHIPPAPSSRSNSTKDSTLTLTNDSIDEWEFPRHKLKVLGILGEGCFGQVWKYEATDLKGPDTGKTFVAVKTLKESAGLQEKKDLQQELKVLKGLGKHPNVVSLLACCTEKEPTLVILEYLVNGKLQSYLRERRAHMPYNNLHGTSASLSPRDLTIFAVQVAKGMDYLSTHGIVHRDLAARNVLVGEDKVCKVADFGFARDVANNHVYERKSDGRLPIRWMALESLYDNIFTSKTDVWSFGILLWEIVTLGSTPYPGMSAEEVMKRIKSGYRLEKPSYCKREMYNIMYYCWYEDAKDRPSFKELVKYLEGLITSEVDYIELNNFPERAYYNIPTAAASGELL
ncbi:tyrosine kinase receptor Cad96Ca isoform X2 [Hyalella azteca]|uniref:receptor protein-tyrosine kinase n=1 Tax=Hyalella azteca TaxID=294128 RepID=A0A979FRM3_HYAAZ|nr:tyrosine kinase receptor Cad96Ca isoform X2 [Hyalella azteca]